MLRLMDFFTPPDETHVDKLRWQITCQLDLAHGSLSNLRVGRPAFYVGEHIENFLEGGLLPPSETQYLVGNYLEVVLTIEGRSFEIAEYEPFGGGMTAFTPVRRSQGAHTFREGASLLEVLSPENRAVVIDSLVRRFSNSRRHRYSRCKFCREMTPPESIFEPNICEECAVSELGVVF